VVGLQNLGEKKAGGIDKRVFFLHPAAPRNETLYGRNGLLRLKGAGMRKVLFI